MIDTKEKEAFMKVSTQDKKISKIIMLQFLAIMITDLFATIFIYLIKVDTENLYRFFWGIRGLLYIPLLITLIENIPIKFMMYYLSWGVIFCFNMLLFPSNRPEIISSMISLLAYCTPVFLGILLIEDIKEFEKQIIKFGYYLYIVGIIHAIIYTTILKKGLTNNPYMMRLSVDFGFAITILLYKLTKKVTVKDLILIIVGIVFILLTGSRNPFISLISFPIIFSFVKGFKYNKRFLIIFIIIIMIFILIILVIYHYGDIIYRYFEIKFGYSRTLYLLLNSDGIHFSGRDIKINLILDELKEQPIMGLGIGGDAIIDGGTYAHNFIVQILSNFGYPIGIVLLIIIGYLCYKGIVSNTCYVSNSLIILFFCTSVLPMLVDFSIWSKLQFWILLSLCIRSIKK